MTIKAKRADFGDTQRVDDAKPIGYINTKVITTVHTPIIPDHSRPPALTDVGDMVTRTLHRHALDGDEVVELSLELNGSFWKDLAEGFRELGNDPEGPFRVR